MLPYRAVGVDSALESLARRDRVVTLAALAALVALAWIYLARLGREMASMAAVGLARMEMWGPGDAALATVMWAVMMVAMMLPAAAPMVVMFATINRKRSAAGGVPPINTGLFTLAYLLVWGGASALAALAQWALQTVALLSPGALTVAPVMGGALLVAAGVYQLTPLKYACLARCQSPIGFLFTEWREGSRGAFVMGLRHGLFCLGCCWALMALLFVGGIMNLVWVAAITVFVLVEKVVPAGRLVSWASGAALIVWGAWVLLVGA